MVAAVLPGPDAVPLQHVQTSEPQAKNLLTNGISTGSTSIKAAFQAGPPATIRQPVVHAPTALTGFAIATRSTTPSAAVDRAQARRAVDRQAAHRVLPGAAASATTGLQRKYRPLAHNPMNITLDPEFIALNPASDARTSSSLRQLARCYMSSDSDVVTALTSYLNADPEARALLDGRPIRGAWWSTRTTRSRCRCNWPLLDTYNDAPTNNCLCDTRAVPAARRRPGLGPGAVAFNLQLDISNSQTRCVVPPAPPTARATAARR